MSYLKKLAEINLEEDDNGARANSNTLKWPEEVDELPEGLDRERMPGHVAMILDGNRRWGKQRGLNPVQGYDAGLNALKHFMITCYEFNIPVISLFLLSSENLFRPKEELAYLYTVFENALTDGLEIFIRIGASVKSIGDISALPISLQQNIKKAEETTRDNTRHQVLMALNYTGQNDIVQACQSIAMKVKDGLLQPEEISKAAIEKQLQTNICSIPCPDLLIRTSGEFRISNYYLWQSAYTELYFTEKLWPDFTKDDFEKALKSYQNRGRRFGKV